MTVTVSASGNIALSAQASKSVSSADPTVGPTNLQMNLPNTANLLLNSSSSISVNDVWSGLVTLVAGTATIDLTNLTQSGLTGAVDMTGKKLKVLAANASGGASANTNPIQIAPGGANGYTSVGTNSALNANDPLIRVYNAPIAVDSSHKNITITGTGTDSVSLILYFGA